MLLGGLFGTNWVITKGKEDKKNLPHVIFTQLFIGEEEVQIGHSYGGKVILSQAMNETGKIVLAHDQNTFTVKFGASNYNQSERLQFNYMMKGLDEDWRTGNALTHGVTFHDLKAGHYILYVKAINAEGLVSDEERMLDITIERHWLLS